MEGERKQPLRLEELSRYHAQHTLELMQGNKLKTAQALGISRTRLYSLLSESDLDEKTG